MHKPGIAAAAVLAIAVLGWWILRAQDAETQAPASLSMQSDLQIPMRLEQPSAESAVSGTGWTQSPADAAWCNFPQSETSGESDFLSPEELESRLKSSPSEQQRVVEKARLSKAWAAALAQRGDERSMAAADLVEGSPESLSKLTDMALHTSDPTVYAWAMNKCYSSGACGLLSARRWVQLDPGNAAPWIYEAYEASERGDEQAVREAVYQIGRSSRNEFYAASMLQIIDGLRNATAPGLQMNLELSHSADLFFSLLVSPSTTLLKHCSAPASYPGRESACLEMADALWQHSDTLIDRLIALGLSKRSPNRDASLWAARADELTAVQAVEAETHRPLANPSGCALLPDVLLHLNGWREQGEWGFLRARLAGRDIAALARRYREETPPPRKPDNPASAAVPAR